MRPPRFSRGNAPPPPPPGPSSPSLPAASSAHIVRRRLRTPPPISTAADQYGRGSVRPGRPGSRRPAALARLAQRLERALGEQAGVLGLSLIHISEPTRLR